MLLRVNALGPVAALVPHALLVTLINAISAGSIAMSLVPQAGRSRLSFAVARRLGSSASLAGTASSRGYFPRSKPS